MYWVGSSIIQRYSILVPAAFAQLLKMPLYIPYDGSDLYGAHQNPSLSFTPTRGLRGLAVGQC